MAALTAAAAKATVTIEPEKRSPMMTSLCLAVLSGQRSSLVKANLFTCCDFDECITSSVISGRREASPESIAADRVYGFRDRHLTGPLGRPAPQQGPAWRKGSGAQQVACGSSPSGTWTSNDKRWPLVAVSSADQPSPC